MKLLIGLMLIAGVLLLAGEVVGAVEVSIVAVFVAAALTLRSTRK
jgi:hypothetical protein